MLLSAKEMKEIGMAAVKASAEKVIEDWVTETLPIAMTGRGGHDIDLTRQSYHVEKCAVETLRTLGYNVSADSYHHHRYNVYWK